MTTETRACDIDKIKVPSWNSISNSIPSDSSDTVNNNILVFFFHKAAPKLRWINVQPALIQRLVSAGEVL